MESTRQKKISRQLQKDLSEIFPIRRKISSGASFVSVTVVRISSDLSVARVYLSVFGIDDKESLLSQIEIKSAFIRKKLALRG